MIYLNWKTFIRIIHLKEYFLEIYILFVHYMLEHYFCQRELKFASTNLNLDLNSFLEIYLFFYFFGSQADLLTLIVRTIPKFVQAPSPSENCNN
jgi:hypothetical protein